MVSNPNESSEAQRKIDMSVPHIARIYDFWLGGKDNFEADREVGRKTAEVNPVLLEGVQWHPDSPEDAANPAEVWGGVARKP